MGLERGFPLLSSLQVALKEIPWLGKSTYTALKPLRELTLQ